jgi:hypothetical protein
MGPALRFAKRNAIFDPVPRKMPRCRPPSFVTRYGGPAPVGVPGRPAFATDQETSVADRTGPAFERGGEGEASACPLACRLLGG